MARHRLYEPAICLFATILLYVTVIGIPTSEGARVPALAATTTATWGSECPRECQCHLTALGHVTMSQWVVDGGAASSHAAKAAGRTGGGSVSPRPLKVAMCVLGPDALLTKLFRKMPADTQVLTMLQTQECPPLVLMEHHVEHLRQLLALEVRAHVPLSSSHLALGSEALRPLRKLQYLSLNGVDLTALPMGLAKLHGLRYLSLRDNQLDSLPKDEISGLLSLEELIVTDNELTEIPPLAFIDLPALRRIHLQRNRIQSLDANSFVNLDELELLDMSGNNVSDISMISFPPLPNLIWLHLHDNPIRVVFLNAFHYLNSTRFLTVGQKQQPMHIMKHSFVGLASVRTLVIPNLDNHMIEKDMFQGLVSLRRLTVRGQIKMTGSDAFAGAYNLESLTLSHCRLRSLASDTFQGLKNLRSLDLSHNAIMKLAVGLFDPFKVLNELQLQDNHLRHLPNQMLGQLRLQMLRLEDNPWHCSCVMAKWNRSPIGRVKTAVYKSCSTTANPTRFDDNNNDNDDGFGGDFEEFHGNSLTLAAHPKSQAKSGELPVNGCRRLRVRYVREPSLRPVCYNPPELRGKRVFEAVRKHLNCYE